MNNNDKALLIHRSSKTDLRVSEAKASEVSTFGIIALELEVKHFITNGLLTICDAVFFLS